MEDLIDKEQEIARQLEAMIKEESMEKSKMREEDEEEQEYEARKRERRKLVREFEADVQFRIQKPVLSEETSQRIPALVQGRAAYQTIAGKGGAGKNQEVLRPRRA